MAALLFWWNHDGAPIDDAIWRRMVAQTARDAGLEKPPETWIEGPNYRALAIRTFPLEPEPVLFHADGSFSLASARFPLSESGRLKSSQDDPAAIIHFSPKLQRLTLIRDLLGQRRLLWSRSSHGLLVATREESLLRHPQVTPEIDEFELACLIHFASGMDDGTVFTRIRAIAPGETLRCSASGTVSTKAVPEPERELAGRSVPQLAEMLRCRLQESVERHTRGIERIGVFLSAGMDSASVAATLAQVRRPNCRPFSLTFGNPQGTIDGVDERALAAGLASRLGFEHRTLEAADPLINADQRPPELPLGEPFYSRFAGLSRRCLQAFRDAGCQVVIGGHGGDFPGIAKHHWMMSAWQDRDILGMLSVTWQLWRHLGLSGLHSHPAIRRWLGYCLLGRQVHHRFPKPSLPAEWLPRWEEHWHAKLRAFSDWPDPTSAAQVFSRHTFHSLTHHEGAANPTRIEFRHPLVDWPYLRFCLSVSNRHWTTPPLRKTLLRAAMTVPLGSEWVKRPRTGAFKDRDRDLKPGSLPDASLGDGHWQPEAHLLEDLGHLEPTDRHQFLEWRRRLHVFMNEDGTPLALQTLDSRQPDLRSLERPLRSERTHRV